MTRDSEVLLGVRGVSKRFGKVVTADDVSFDVAPGTALGIVGPNGAGKSTLLSMITGVLRPDAGQFTFAGEDISAVPAAGRAARGVNRTFQIPRPFADMTVFENALVAAQFAGGSRGQAGYDDAAEALEITGLLPLANSPAGGLRLLDRKRLELARALATQPKLLLLDEIAGGLTDKELPPLIEMISGLRDSGVTIVWIEHIVHALVAVVDDLLCLAFGRVLAQGDPREVMRSKEVIEIYLGSTFEAGDVA